MKELDELKGKKQRVIGSNESIIDRTTVKRRSREMNASSTNNPDLHDDNDYVIYDNADVNRLAAGSSTLKQQSSSHDMTQQINTNNRAKEYSHPKELFSSDDEDDMIVV